MHAFQINVLIQFLASSTCFELRVHHQEDHLYIQFCMVCFSYILSKQSSMRKCRAHPYTC